MEEAKRSGWRDMALRLQGRIRKAADDNRETIRDVSLMVGNFGGAALIGFMHGRNGAMPTYVGVPLDVWIWGAGSAVSFAFRRQLGDYGTAMALGASLSGQTYYVASVFAGIGQKMRKDKGEMLNRQYTADELAKGHYAARPVITAGPMPGMVQQPRRAAPPAWY